MAGGKATGKKDEVLKVSQGQPVKTGTILCRGINRYKAGKNVKGEGTVYAIACGTVYFTKKKSPKGSVRTFINILPK
ncbi:MAG: 50S ribosomal protein L27 [Candidatus Omnitrophica bacterium]|jgi:ribosomal protein L27|nr:50S ribosomal protein L27 [Candidatus Omnitrophota bacterium]